MDTVINVIKILSYFGLILLTYIFAKNGKTKKIPLTLVIVISLFFGLMSIWFGKYPYSGDRLNFAFRFEDTTGVYNEFVANSSLGLYWLESILHTITHDANVLFFTVAFLFMFVCLTAYNHSKVSTPFALLVLLLSGFPIFAFYMLKQSMAMAFVTLAYSFYSRDQKFRGIICLAIAIAFHEVAWIVVPLVIALNITKGRFSKSMLLILTAMATFFFDKINAFVLSIATNIVPSLVNQTAHYLGDDGTIARSGSGFVTSLKGIPFYYLLFMALCNRKTLNAKIEKNDNYLIVTSFVAATFVLSGFMYWMFRFGLLFYAPTSDYASMVYSNTENDKSRRLLTIFIIIVPFLLSAKLLAQYFFEYGGI